MDCVLFRRIAQGALLAIYSAAWIRAIIGDLFGFPPFIVPLRLTVVFVLILSAATVHDIPLIVEAFMARRRNGSNSN